MLAKSTTWITTGATHAPASSAATAPIVNARPKLPRAPPEPTLPPKREKSISKTSNIASASAMKSTAMPRLNQGDALMVPNVLAVSTTTRPSTP